MSEQAVHVECYSGYKGDERPVRIVFEAQTLEIEEVEDRWYSPASLTFACAWKAATGTCCATKTARIVGP